MSESASKPTFSIAQRIRRKPRRFQGALSPWSRRFLGLHASSRPGRRIARSPASGLTRISSQPRSGLFQSHIPTAGTAARHSRAKAQRASNNAHRIRVWRPGLGGVSPTGVHRFSNHIARRFDAGPGSRYQNKPGQTFKPIEMPLYNRGGRTELVTLRRTQWQSVKTPQSTLDKALPTKAPPPPNFMRAKKAVAENQAPKPSIPKRARLFSLVEENTSTDPPTFIDQAAIETENAPQPSAQQPTKPPPAPPETANRDSSISSPLTPKDFSTHQTQKGFSIPHQRSSPPLTRQHNRRNLRLNTSTSPIQARRRVTATMEQRGWRFKRSTAQTSGSPTMIYRAASRLDRAAATGRPLQGRPRAIMRQTFGRDFGKVRIHKADLSPLNVEAATRGQDVYMQDDNLNTPASLGTLGHELSHVAHSEGDTSSAKPKLQMAALPQARISQEERSAEQAEHAVHSSMDMPMTRPASASLQRAPQDNAPSSSPSQSSGAEENESTDPNDMGLLDDMESFGELRIMVQNASRQLAEMGLYPPDVEQSPQDQEQLQSIDAIEVSDETTGEVGVIAAMMNIIIDQESEDEDSVLKITDDELDHLAMRVYPFLKRLLAVERERYAVQEY